jgi:glycosyltransferase involved in cell wall biosynthesis
MNNPVSITAVICNYNGGVYLKEAIDSVLAQKPLPDEFIIVDDRSTDNSIEIIRKVQREHPELIKVIQHDENKGQAAGMNTAFASSRGEIIAFLDSDDVWFPNKLAALCDAYRSQPDFGLFQHNLQIIKDHFNTEELYMPAMTQGDVFELWQRYGTFPNFSPTSGLAIRREIYDKLAPLPEELKICADSFMTRSAICFGPVVSTLAPFGGYRRHSSNNVYGNSKLDGWQFVLDKVSPLLADFYQSHGFALPAHIRPRHKIPEWKKLIDKVLDVNIRSIISLVRDIKKRKYADRGHR